jgi:branched-chain amino acid transport system permease protein
MTDATWRVTRSTRAGRIGLVLLVLAVILLACAPWWAGRAGIRLMAEIATMLALAQLWNLLAGYAGLVSIGQQAFVGTGGYALFLLSGFLDVPPLLAIPLAGVVAGLLAIPTALIVFRLRGAYFAIGTWVVAEVYRLSFAQVSVLGGGSGMSLPADAVRSIAEGRDLREALVYWVALAVGLASVGFAWWILRSRLGLALNAIRDGEAAAQSLGVDAYRTKLAVYVAVAAATGVIGAIIFLQKLRISPDAAFAVNDFTAFVIFIVVIGGIGRIEGPIVGTLLFFALRGIASDWGAWYLILLGLIAIAVMLKAPSGLWGLLAARRALSLFPVQRRVVPIEKGPP